MKLSLNRLIPIFTTVLALGLSCMMSGCGVNMATANSVDENIDQQVVNVADDASNQTANTVEEDKSQDMAASNMTDDVTDDLAASQADEELDKELDEVISAMSMDEKISQLIIPAIRTWNDEDVTDLGTVPELAYALRNHQYGGIILFAGNITGTEQATRLVYALQDNNMQIEGASAHIPYLMPVDEEGGKVIRLNSGTRMTGNMAIGATDDAEQNAELTGRILGEELAAIGFNADFAPVIDVNNNPSNPVIGTRSFSDDPETVASLGTAYAKGLAESGIIATYKHFPGHGDTATDSHIGTPSVEKTYEELLENELVPFKKVIEDGADMIMTAHITYPLIDEEKTFADGNKGYFPATMSEKMITEILRSIIGYNGVVVTDALEMNAIRVAGLVSGKENSAEYGVGIAEEVINAGVDMLLIPRDITSPTAASFYDEYVAGIIAKVENGEISEKRIDESVKRILKLKAKYGIYDPSGTLKDDASIEEIVAGSKEVVGSAEHHEKEMEIARQAITVVKNDGDVLPITDDSAKAVIIGLQPDEAKTVNYALDEMSKSADVNYYYNSSGADYVIAFSYTADSSVLDKRNKQVVALQNAITRTHEAGGKFILVSENLPYDAAVYQDADAIVLAYMGAGLNVDPTREKVSETGMSAGNANVVAAIETIYGVNTPKGHLPVNVPVVEEAEDGTLNYGTDYLYKRGFGLTF